MVVIDDIELTLPAGWIEARNPGEPASFWPRSDRTTGVLQLSRLDDSMHAYLASRPDLGDVAVELGLRLGFAGETADPNDARGQPGTCVLGRYGFAMFRGRFPAAFLWVTLAPDAAHMWTWLGPSTTDDETTQAVRIVLEARARR